MEKSFPEVFPELRINDQTRKLFEKVSVTKVSLTQARDLLRIYVISDTWIHKKYIYEAEEAIKEQCFGRENLTVKIIEKFHLSSQYTAENLFPLYLDSILLELKEYSIL